MNILDPQIKEMVVELNELHSVLRRSSSAGNVTGMFVELGTAISKVIDR